MTPTLPGWVDTWCRTFLGAQPVEVLFVAAHLSEVVGVRLSDGREVVVKRRGDNPGRTPHCVAAQRLLAEGGFPCPLPLTDVTFDAAVAVHAERFVPGGAVETEDSPAAAARSAALLAELVRRLEAVPVPPPLPNPEWIRWESPPERHLSAPFPGWLADTSRRVRERLVGSRLPPVLGHVDWEAQNMRWSEGEPLAVHDWDSLGWLSEAVLAGTAAGVFASHGSPTLAPLESSAAFLDGYECERGKRFSEQESQVAWAASIWVALHNARDEVIYDREPLCLEELKAQRLERLSRAEA